MPLPIRELPPASDLAKLAQGGDVSGVSLVLTLFLTARELYASTERFFARFDISDAKWSVLMLLATAPAKRLQPSEIAAKLAVTRATVTGLLKGLERDRLVTRSADEADGRFDVIRLSRAGAALLRTMMPALANRHATATAGLSARERQQLVALLHKVRIPADD
jgi:DNA-binding MarR family transcriptional regulator